MHEIDVSIAYFDPGIGSMLFQVLFGLFFSFVFFFNKIKSFFVKKESRKTSVPCQEKEEDEK